MSDNQFEAFLADTSQAKQIHYQLRYKIYCLEKRYENPAAYSKKQEWDAHDFRSAHFIIRSRNSAKWLGAMRLIIGAPAVLPITTLATIESQAIAELKDKITAEASRLCVLPARLYRQPSHSGSRTSRVNRENILNLSADSSYASWISLNLIRAARRYCMDHDIRYCFFFITDSLARILTRVGMEIRAIGPANEHRGLRRPYIHDVHDGYTAMAHKAPLVHAMFQGRPAYRRFSDLTGLNTTENARAAASPAKITRSRTSSAS